MLYNREQDSEEEDTPMQAAAREAVLQNLKDAGNPGQIHAGGLMLYGPDCLVPVYGQFHHDKKNEEEHHEKTWFWLNAYAHAGQD